MKPIFTIHEGEFLVGDYISRVLGKRYEVWVPTKDSGIDLLVTRKRGPRKAVALQVKFSRGFDINEEMVRKVIATSWFTLDPRKIKESQADIWVFVIMTVRHEKHFVLVPTKELRKRIPRGCGKTWNLYLWIYEKGLCFQVRDLKKEEKLSTMYRGVHDNKRDFSGWLGNWKLLDKCSKR